jgi:UDP:flavonoid glycosyltransferase YjiC (YdhE family)
MQRKILVAPLDWGLGHATRCIPIIQEFLSQGCEVQIATSGDALILLKQEFRNLKFHQLTSYGAEYSRSIPFMVKILLQLPKFLRAINREHKETAAIIEQEKIDFVISDNRYGCWAARIPSIFIGHQLRPMASFFSPIANYFQQLSIGKFSEVWIPDVEGTESLTGDLSMTEIKVKHIGLLSRMNWSRRDFQYEIMAIISGPEPQRTVFEEIVIPQLERSQKRCLVVQGLPGGANKTKLGEVEIVNHLTAAEMNKAILEAEIIVSRSGYSTIMDLAVLGKKAIFVPTPGQSEQEYLATRSMKSRAAFAMRQERFNLNEALKIAEGYNGFNRAVGNSRLKKAIEQLINEAN